ncbi:hypothetical protein VTN00DRAFT_4910 [Thermoascus crustaceus]|uniref:uncharacterized protein n=1 Tax=Thermoascus crustaceus TaxID=5088 RepID=UPI0037427EF9
MASYEIEHNTTSEQQQNTTTTRPRRPDLSTFFATLSEISPRPAESRTRIHAVPVPADVSAAFRSLAEAFDVMRRNLEVGGGQNGDGQGEGGGLLSEMITALLREAETPPREVEGVSEEFCDGLDRIPRTSLKPSQTCPICNTPFLEDPYPLVVRLPCHPTHLFDLECVRPWLRLRGTCPLDRADFGKKEREKEAERRRAMERRFADEEDEDDYDGMYA